MRCKEKMSRAVSRTYWYGEQKRRIFDEADRHMRKSYFYPQAL
jgi:hypothetical protein